MFWRILLGWCLGTLAALGTLTCGPLTHDIFRTLVFDARNRLLSAGRVTNIYDAMNNRFVVHCGTNPVVH